MAISKHQEDRYIPTDVLNKAFENNREATIEITLTRRSGSDINLFLDFDLVTTELNIVTV